VFGPKGVEIKSLEDLSGKRVGVVRGNLQDTELTKKAPADTKLVRFDDDATTITALMSGQVDAMCAPYGMYLTLAERYPAKELEPKAEVVQQPLGIGLRQNEPELKAWLRGLGREGRRRRLALHDLREVHGRQARPGSVPGRSAVRRTPYDDHVEGLPHPVRQPF
jgi:polar amino acid transport system substrate-binding protein